MTADAPIDPATVQLGKTNAEQDIPCPLCGYNLRGLPAARCPECGGQFEWIDLLDPSRKVHPYLFEHHPERKIRAYFRTLIAGWLPRRFWKKLHPAQKSRPHLLVLYWAIGLLLCLLPPATQFGLAVWNQYAVANQQRAFYTDYLKNPKSGTMARSNGSYASRQQIDQILRTWPTIDAYIDRIAPKPTLGSALSQTRKPFSRLGGAGSLARGALPYTASDLLSLASFVWPWMACATMLIFRTTMRRAKVRLSHLLRVTIYSGDVIVWGALIQLAILGISYLLMRILVPRGAIWSSGIGQFFRLPIYIPFFAALIVAYRLAVAIKEYLHFRHALATAISVQIIFVLLAGVVYMTWVYQ